MEKVPVTNKKVLQKLKAELKVLQEALAAAHKREGKDPYIEVKVAKNQGRFQKIEQNGVADKTLGKFFLEIVITAKQETVYVPISAASGKKTAGFMYQIEGTAAGSIVGTEIKVRGEGVSQVTLGTLIFAKVPGGSSARFQIQATIKGDAGKAYKIVITRINYKLELSEVRYEQYLKEIHSDSIKLS